MRRGREAKQARQRRALERRERQAVAWRKAEAYAIQQYAAMPDSRVGSEALRRKEAASIKLAGLAGSAEKAEAEIVVLRQRLGL